LVTGSRIPPPCCFCFVHLTLSAIALASIRVSFLYYLYPSTGRRRRRRPVACQAPRSIPPSPVCSTPQPQLIMAVRFFPTSPSPRSLPWPFRLLCLCRRSGKRKFAWVLYLVRLLSLTSPSPLPPSLPPSFLHTHTNRPRSSGAGVSRERSILSWSSSTTHSSLTAACGPWT